MFTDRSGLWFGIDDAVTGPVDEIIVFAVISIMAAAGVEGASGALDNIGNSISGIIESFGNWWNSIQNAISQPFQDDIGHELGDIAGKYGIFQCVEAAQAMMDYLYKNGIPYGIIEIRFPVDPGYVYSLKWNRVISQNGYHKGVIYGNRVYCNVHPYGLVKNVWINDFIGVGEKVVTQIL